MKTAPVVTITDEIIAELDHGIRTMEWPARTRAHFEALLAERASLLADARRIDWLECQFKTCTVYMDGQHPWSPNSYKLRELRGPTFRIAIDQAM